MLHRAALGARGSLSSAVAATTAAVASAGGGGGSSAAAGFASTAAPQAVEQGECLYTVLGVHQGATQQELKAAFRKRAKELHPDASPSAAASTGPAFVQLLAAYKVLSSPRSRQLYDLSRDASAGPRVLRAAAAAGVQSAADAAYEEVPVDLSWGLGSLFSRPPEGGALDHIRQELQGELHSAVRRAYLGPKLERGALEEGWLPEAFEADERAVADSPDLLQLVSGRQVLGVVRERRAELLERQQAAAAAALQEGREPTAAAAAAAALPALALAAAAEAWQHGAQAGSWRLQGQGEQLQGQQELGQQGQQSQQQAAQHGHHGQHGRQQQAARQGQQAQQGQHEPYVLDLFVGDRLVASAVRHTHLPPGPDSGHSSSREGAPPGSRRHGCEPQRGQPQEAQEQQGQEEGHGRPAEEHQQATGGRQQQQQQPSALPAEVVGIYSPTGELLAQVEAQQPDPGSATASSARLLDGAGRHTHTVYRTQTPLVRHLTFSAEPSATGLRTRRPSRLVVCRCRRAWLPPSSLWIFKPLSYSHDVGGWYLEWAGHERRRHPAALHPAVFVLTAAFDSLDHERAARQPLGLFGRLRAGAAAGDTAGQGPGGAATAQQQREGQGGWRGWISSALRFHGVGT